MENAISNLKLMKALKSYFPESVYLDSLPIVINSSIKSIQSFLLLLDNLEELKKVCKYERDKQENNLLLNINAISQIEDSLIRLIEIIEFVSGSSLKLSKQNIQDIKKQGFGFSFRIDNEKLAIENLSKELIQLEATLQFIESDMFFYEKIQKVTFEELDILKKELQYALINVNYSRTFLNDYLQSEYRIGSYKCLKSLLSNSNWVAGIVLFISIIFVIVFIFH